MLAELFLTVVLTAGGFNAFNECYVRGYIYSENGKVQLYRDDSCDVTVQEIEDVIIIHDKKHWVYIKFPIENIKGNSGHASFWYRWGATNAFFNVQPIEIKWGTIVKG
jgi:hypothetical protein